MTDHAWEDHAEKAFNAAAWVLEQLREALDMLEDNDESEFNEFAIAAQEVKGLEERLTDIRNRCYFTRDGDRDLADMDRLMDEVGGLKLSDQELAARKLKLVGNVHFPEEANTGVEGGIGFLVYKIADYLNGKESWDNIIKRAALEVAERSGEDWILLKEEHGPFSARQEGDSYKFLIYNKRTNLMNEFRMLDELRAVDEMWPRPLKGQQANVRVGWNGIPSGERPGFIGATSESFVMSFSTTHFSHLLETLEKMPAQITKYSLENLGFKVL